MFFLSEMKWEIYRKGIIYLKNTIIDLRHGPKYASELKESFTTKDISNWRPFTPLWVRQEWKFWVSCYIWLGRCTNSKSKIECLVWFLRERRRQLLLASSFPIYVTNFYTVIIIWDETYFVFLLYQLSFAMADDHHRSDCEWYLMLGCSST